MAIDIPVPFLPCSKPKFSFPSARVCTGNLVFSEWSRDVLRIYEWWPHGEEGGHSRAALASRTAQTQEEEEEEEREVRVREVLIV